MEWCTADIKAFYKNNNNFEVARQEFHHHFNLGHHDPFPSAHAIKMWVMNFEETDSAMKKKPPGCNEDEQFIYNICFSDKAHFYLNGTVNK